MASFSSVLLALVSLALSEDLTSKECPNLYHCNNADITADQTSCSGRYSCDRSTITSLDEEGYINCNGMFACNLADSLEAERNIYCSGFKSCYISSKIEGRNVICSGDSSCDHRVSPESPVKAHNILYCGASESCYSSSLTAGNNALCQGSRSCAESMITSDEIYADGTEAASNSKISSDIANCAGKRSCKGATIKSDEARLYGTESGAASTIIGVPLVEAYGFQSILNAVIDSQVKEIVVKAFGEAAGKGATLICRSGATCSLLCKNSGCLDMEYRCLPGATCNISPALCDEDNSVDQVKGVQCPTRTVGIQKDEIEETEEESQKILVKALDDDEALQAMDDDEEVSPAMDDTPYDPNHAILTDSFNCNKEYECQGQIIMDETTITCQASESCHDAVISNDASKILSSIGCYGHESCDGAKLTSNKGFVSCLAEAACDGATINARNARCGAMDACQNTEEITVEAQMDCSASAACKGSTITNHKSTSCSACRACYDATIEAGEDIKCDGHYSCSEALLTVGQNVECNGKGSCHKATISAGDRIYVNGHYGAAFSDIKADLIRGLGYHSLAHSMIDSNGKATMTVQAFGHLSGYGSTMICRAGTKCELECRSSGCKNMDYICMNGAQCNLKPKLCKKDDMDTFKGIDCPNMMTNIPEVYQILKRKQYTLEKDEVYKKYNHEIEKDEQQYNALSWKKLDYDLNAQIEEEEDDEIIGEETELFGDVGTLSQDIEGINMMELLLIIVGSIFIIALGFSWYKLKFRGNIYEQLK